MKSAAGKHPWRYGMIIGCFSQIMEHIIDGRKKKKDSKKRVAPAYFQVSCRNGTKRLAHEKRQAHRCTPKSGKNREKNIQRSARDCRMASAEEARNANLYLTISAGSRCITGARLKAWP